MWILVTIALIGMSIIIFLSAPTSSDGIRGPAAASVWGYGAMAISVLGIIFTIIGDKLKLKPDHKTGGSIKWLLFTIPAFLMLFVLIFIITMTSHYYIRINKGEVSEDYYKYSSLATLTISTQYLLLVYYILTTVGPFNTHDKYAIATYLNYMFATGNIIIIIMLTIVAKYFITDG